MKQFLRLGDGYALTSTYDTEKKRLARRPLGIGFGTASEMHHASDAVYTPAGPPVSALSAEKSRRSRGEAAEQLAGLSQANQEACSLNCEAGSTPTLPRGSLGDTSGIPRVYLGCGFSVMPKKNRGDGPDITAGSAPCIARRPSPKPNTFATFVAVVLALFMCLTAAQQVSAQEAEPADAVLADIKPLQIGDTIPEELWNLPLQVVNHPEGKDTITLNDYRDKKLIILDFWATWCVPCISSLYKLDTLQAQFTDELAVIPTTYEKGDKVDPFFAERGWALLTATSETYLRNFFPYQFIPHQVWIKDNMLKAIVYPEDANPANINQMLAYSNFTLHTKKDVLDYSATTSLSLFAEKMGVPIFASLAITPHIEGIPASTGIVKSGGRVFVNYTNVSLVTMYRNVLKTRNNRIAIKGSNISKYDNSIYTPEKVYCLQLVITDTNDDNQVRDQTLHALNTQFNLRLDSQIVETECFVISKLRNRSIADEIILHEEKLGEEKGKTVASLVSLLNFSIIWTPAQPVFVDISGYDGEIKTESYEILRNDVDKLKANLMPYGLGVTKEKRPVKMYILSETIPE